MRVLTGLAVTALLLSFAPASGEETKKRAPEKREDKARSESDDEVKVYTNADLEKMFGGAGSKSGSEASPDEASPEESEPAESKPDPLVWLQERQAEQQARRVAVADAEKALAAARARLAGLERQLLATRNPFAARPDLSDEEKERRAESDETASERYDRTKKLVEEARQAVSAAEAELARVRGQRP